jgi:hypothetical protein
MEWPATDTIGPEGWHYQLRATMAAAIEAFRGRKGGAVMSKRKSNSKTLTKRALTRRSNGARRLVARRKTPLGRLHTNGSCKPEYVRRRLHWLAYERRIPEKDLPKVQCNPTDELLDFAEKYNISLDWLLRGDLKGLHRMMGKPCAAVSMVERIMKLATEKYGQLSPDRQRIITEEVNRMLAERAVERPEGA